MLENKKAMPYHREYLDQKKTEFFLK